jgi:hypothetical protein
MKLKFPKSKVGLILASIDVTIGILGGIILPRVCLLVLDSGPAGGLGCAVIAATALLPASIIFSFSYFPLGPIVALILTFSLNAIIFYWLGLGIQKLFTKLFIRRKNQEFPQQSQF